MDLTHRAFWNEAAAATRFSHPVRTDWLEALGRDARILDYGCGYGRTLQTLYESGLRNALGVDFSPAMVKRGRRDFPHLALKAVDALPLDEPDGAFDVVLLFAVLTCIPIDAEQHAVMNEARRLLRPGGLLYLSDYPLQSDGRNRDRYAAGYAKYGVYGVFDRAEGGTFRHHEPSRLDALMTGLEPVVREEIDTSTLGGNPARVLQMLGRRSPLA